MSTGAYRTIPDPAVAAGARANPFLMRRLAANRASLDHAATAIGVALDETLGHKHHNASATLSYPFEDRIITVTGVNDRIPFRFASSSPDHAAADYSPTLSAGTRTPAAHAAAVQLAMQTAVDSGSPSSVPLTVVYDMAVGSKTRGLFVFGHTGALDSPNGRVLWLLFATGTGAIASVANTMGFAAKDRRKGFGYRGDSGFTDGITQDSFTLTNGGLLTDVAWVSGAFTTAELGAHIIPTAAFQNGAVEGSAGANNIAGGAATGPKLGEPANDTHSILGSGGAATFTLHMGQTGSGRIPEPLPLNSGGAVAIVPADLEISTPSYIGTDEWHVLVTNKGTTTTVTLLAY